MIYSYNVLQVLEKKYMNLAYTMWLLLQNTKLDSSKFPVIHRYSHDYGGFNQKLQIQCTCISNEDSHSQINSMKQNKKKGESSYSL